MRKLHRLHLASLNRVNGRKAAIIVRDLSKNIASGGSGNSFYRYSEDEVFHLVVRAMRYKGVSLSFVKTRERVPSNLLDSNSQIVEIDCVKFTIEEWL